MDRLTKASWQTLRHIFHHGTYLYPELHRRLDVTQAMQPLLAQDAEDNEPLYARSRSARIERLLDRKPAKVETLLRAAREGSYTAESADAGWTLDEIPGPDVTDKATVLNLARMAKDAYMQVPDTGDWDDVGLGFNASTNFGWQSDGLRGQIFADETNSTIIMSIKGTSLAVFDGAETTTNDKENDNLFFSCCCGQGGHIFWRKVCDCSTSTYTCNQTCLVQALKGENRYYRAALDLYANVTSLYPSSNIWLTGHSLGGSVSSLLGLTYGLPVVTFEAPAEALAATRLGIPTPPGSSRDAPQRRLYTGSYHFGHTADPIFMGVCNGATSGCSLAGYALETQCHAGKECIYDVVQDKGWRVGVGTHQINEVIRDVIQVYDTVPECKANTECIDCFNWKYYEGNRSDTTSTSSTSTSTSRTRTKTSTCKTPGWWGCLDETTTTGSTTSTSSTSTSTTTCHTPGWFGCKDKTTTTAEASPGPTATATARPTESNSVALPPISCVHPGHSGSCQDEMTTVSTTSAASTGHSLPSITAPSTTTSRESRVTSTSTPHKPKRRCKRRCKRRWLWIGPCIEWECLREAVAYEL